MIPIRSKDGSEMEIVFIFEFNQPNQPIIFYNIQFKFILSFYAYDKKGFRIEFLLLSLEMTDSELQSLIRKYLSQHNGTLNEFLADQNVH